MIRAEIKKNTGKVRYIAQIAELIYAIPFQINLTFPVFFFFLKISARIMEICLLTCNRQEYLYF